MADRSVHGPDIEYTVSHRRDPYLGTNLDGYRIDSKIAEGGFGAVYRATHIASGDIVALKVLHPHFARDPNMTARFQRESATMARLRNRHTVTTREVGEDVEGTLYIAMELLVGESLHERLLRGKLPWQEAVHIALAVCESLAEAHALGVVHRDLKPANIHLCKGNGFVKVLDFGIVEVRGSKVDDGEELTRAGMTVGTLDYMSPEQVMDKPTDARSDLYALGVMVYEMVTGTRPYGALTGPQLLAAMLTTSPTPVSAHIEVPAALERVIMKCLRRDPRNRFEDVHSFATQLEMIVGKKNELDDDEHTTWCTTPTTGRGKSIGTAPTAQATAQDEAERGTVTAPPPPPAAPVPVAYALPQAPARGSVASPMPQAPAPYPTPAPVYVAPPQAFAPQPVATPSPLVVPIAAMPPPQYQQHPHYNAVAPPQAVHHALMHPSGYPQVPAHTPAQMHPHPVHMPLTPQRAARGSVAEMNQREHPDAMYPQRSGWTPPVAQPGLMPRPLLPPQANVVALPEREPKPLNKLAIVFAILMLLAISAALGALLHEWV